MKIKVGVSKKRVHLTEETFHKLFNEVNLEVRNYLKQPGEYASTSTVDLKLNGKIISHVRVVGPLRKYNQIELDRNTASELGINPPVRQSGDLADSLSNTIAGPNGELETNGVIVAERHIHMSEEDANKYHLQNHELIKVYKNDKYLFDAHIKIGNFVNELHIDTEEEIIYDLHQDSEVEIYVENR